MASRYSYRLGDADAAQIGATVRRRGHMTKPEFLAICKWKTPRSQKRCSRNPAALVEEATRVALSADSEKLRIGVLILLEGVDWATGSVILHFCHRDPYPILDYRAFWSLGANAMPHVTFEIWTNYVETCRSLAARTKMSMRDVDRGLWQFSKENQPLVD